MDGLLWGEGVFVSPGPFLFVGFALPLGLSSYESGVRSGAFGVTSEDHLSLVGAFQACAGFWFRAEAQ